MLSIHQFALYLHIAVGSCALILFWIPTLTRKGNLDHKRFGRYFAYAMYTVSLSGILMASTDLAFPIAMHAPGVNLTAEESLAISNEVRDFALFLLSLSILVLTSTRHGWLSILHKNDRQALRSPVHTGLCVSLIVVGLALFANGLRTGSTVFVIFAILQIITGINNLRYSFKKELKPKEWWLQHLSGLFGAGIGAYTAFFVFGGRRIMESLFGGLYTDYSIVLWIAPGIIGGLAIGFVSRHYKQKFGGAWLVRKARIRSTLFS
ncbi:MAG: DUF308 domain-containing protein [Gammaproteobacteria bacterium]|nr:DUF308 domain-containing protein [Gammaproteobacteria bacterium]